MIKNVYRSAACTEFFPQYLINGNIFEKRIPNKKCVFWFTLHLLSETFLILRRTERYLIKNVYRSAACTEIFSTFIHKRKDFLNKVTEYKMCALIFSITFVWNISHSKKNWARYDHKFISVCCMYRNFSILSLKRQDFRKKDTEYKMCVLIFSTTFVWNISHSKKNWERYEQNVYSSAAFTEICSTLSHKLHDFRKKFTEIKMSILIFTTTFACNIPHSKKNWARYDQKCISVCCMYRSFSSLSLKRDDFTKKYTEYKMCVLFISTTFAWNISHSKKNWARYDRKCISFCCMYRNFFHIIS
jgi:FtsH-binding integral membrane protein